MMNYGDAVAHLHIARRVFDSHQPRLTQLGSVWLPLPHLLMLPFVQVYSWWADGIAALPASILAYLAACAGIYRLARRWLHPLAACLALAFFALNPNLLYLQTTAMTEPLFVCEMIWVAVGLVEWRDCLETDERKAGRLQAWIAVALIAAVFTRYESGWLCCGGAGCAPRCFGWRASSLWLRPSSGSPTTPWDLAIGYILRADPIPPKRLKSALLRTEPVRCIRAGTIRGFRCSFL
jgi:hypothetical protein